MGCLECCGAPSVVPTRSTGIFGKTSTYGLESVSDLIEPHEMVIVHPTWLGHDQASPHTGRGLSYRDTYDSLCVLLEEYADADIETVANQILAMFGLLGEDLMEALDPPTGLETWLRQHGLSLIQTSEGRSPRVCGRPWRKRILRTKTTTTTWRRMRTAPCSRAGPPPGRRPRRVPHHSEGTVWCSSRLVRAGWPGGRSMTVPTGCRLVPVCRPRRYPPFT